MKPHVCVELLSHGLWRQYFPGLVVSLVVMFGITGCEVIRVSCDAGGNLAETLNRARPGSKIAVTGKCVTGTGNEQLVVKTDGVVIDGSGTAILDGNGGATPVITFDGAKGVIFRGFTVRNGQDGIVITNASQVAMEGITTTENKGDGLLVTNRGFAYIGSTDVIPSEGREQPPSDNPDITPGRSEGDLGCVGSSCNGGAMVHGHHDGGWLAAIKAYWAGLSVARIAGFNVYAANQCVFDGVQNGGYGAHANGAGSGISSNSCVKNLNGNLRGGMAVFDQASALIAASTVTMNNNRNNGNVPANRRGAGLLVENGSTVTIRGSSDITARNTATQAAQRVQLDGIRVYGGNLGPSTLTIRGGTVRVLQNRNSGITVGVNQDDTSTVLCVPQTLTIQATGNGQNPVLKRNQATLNCNHNP